MQLFCSIFVAQLSPTGRLPVSGVLFFLFSPGHYTKESVTGTASEAADGSWSPQEVANSWC